MFLLIHFLSEEGEYCTIGSPGSPVPTTICGPGLKCMPDRDGDHPKCAKSMYSQQSQNIEHNSHCLMLDNVASYFCDK